MDADACGVGCVDEADEGGLQVCAAGPAYVAAFGAAVAECEHHSVGCGRRFVGCLVWVAEPCVPSDYAEYSECYHGYCH